MWSPPGGSPQTKRRKHIDKGSKPQDARGQNARVIGSRTPVLFNVEENRPKKVRFVIIKASEGDQKSISPFVAHKAITGCAGDPVNIKKLREGNYLVECHNDVQASRLLKISSFYDKAKVVAEPHARLNSSKGVIRSFDLQTATEEEILENIKEQNVEHVKQIKNKRGPTASYILTFKTPHLPKSSTAGYLNLPVEPYIPAPLRCFKCLKFGHTTEKCKLPTAVCKKCSKEGHDDTNCVNLPYCINCDDGHEPLHRQCPSFLREKAIKKIQVEKKIPMAEAKEEYRRLNPWVLSQTFAQTTKGNNTQASNVNFNNQIVQDKNTKKTSSIAIQTEQLNEQVILPECQQSPAHMEVVETSPSPLTSQRDSP